jgi:hypothetical protein
MAISCNSQNISKDEVPSLVLNSLKTKYPFSTDVKWQKHGNFYEAEFDINDTTEVSAQIDENGNIIMEKQDIPYSELNLTVTSVIKTQFRNYKMDDIEKIEKNGNVYYQVELKRKGKKELNLVFSNDGQEQKSISYWD